MKKKLPLVITLVSILSLSSCADQDTRGYYCLSEFLEIPITDDDYYSEEELIEMSDFVYDVTIKEQQYETRVTTFDINHLFMSDEAAAADNQLYKDTNGQQGLPGYNWYYTYYELKVNTIIKEDIEIETYYDEYFPDWDEEVDGLKCMITAGAFFFGATENPAECYHSNADEELIVGYDYRVYLKYWPEQNVTLTCSGILGQGAKLLTKTSLPTDETDSDIDLDS